MNLNGNIIIVFEGPDGSGKTTQCEKLKEYLEERKIRNFYFKSRVKTRDVYKMICKIEENNNISGNKFPKWLKSSLIAYERSKQLYDFFNSVSDSVIIVDKYIYSTEIYLDYKGIPSEYPEMLLAWLPEPDLLIYFDANADLCMERIRQRGERIGVNENEEFLSILNRDMKKKIYEKVHNVIFIDASQDIKKMFGDIKKSVDNLLVINEFHE